MQNEVQGIVGDEKRAEQLKDLKQLWEKSYDLSNNAGKQAFVEALTEVGRHAALTCKEASISLHVGEGGLTGVVVSSFPSPV